MGLAMVTSDLTPLVIEACKEIWGGTMGLMFDTMTKLLGGIVSFGDSFWDDPLLQSLVSVTTKICISIWAISVLVAIFDIVEAISTHKPVYVLQVGMDFLKAFAFASFAPSGVVVIFVYAGRLINAVNTSAYIVDYFDSHNLQPLNGLVFLAVTIACVAFCWISLRRFGVMVIYMLSAPLYVPGIARGDTAAMGSWLRQVIGTTVTFVVQYLLFYFGLTVCATTEGFYVALGFWLAMGQVGKALDKYGFSCGFAGAGSQVMSVAHSLTGMISSGS